MDGFAEVGGGYVGCGFEVGDGAGCFEDTVVGLQVQGLEGSVKNPQGHPCGFNCELAKTIKIQIFMLLQVLILFNS